MTYQNIKCDLVLRAVVGTVICVPSLTFADQWFFDPSITISAGYDDNPALEAGSLDDIEDLEGAIDPLPAPGSIGNSSQSFVLIGADLLLETQSETDILTIGFGGDFTRFEDSSLDTESLDASVDFIRNLERNELAFSLGYLEESTISSSLPESDIGLVGGDIDRNTLSLGAGISSDISQSLTSSLNLDFDEVTFQQGNTSAATSDLTEFEETTLSFSVSNTFSERLTGSIGLGTARFRPTSELESGEASKEDSLSLTLGVNYLLKENLEFILNFAPTETTTTEFGTGNTLDSSTNLYELGIEYTGFQNSFAFSVSSVLSASALGRLVETDNVSLSWSRINTLGGTFQSSVSLGQESSGDTEGLEGVGGNREFFDLELTYRKSFRRNINWFIEYLFRNRQSVLGQDVDSNRYLAGLEYRWGRRLLPVGTN